MSWNVTEASLVGGVVDESQSEQAQVIANTMQRVAGRGDPGFLQRDMVINPLTNDFSFPI
jgi:hypothetical protein